MTEGPLGLPRPLTKVKVTVSKEPLDVDVQFTGPLGGSRPFAQSADDEVTEEDIQECMESKAAHEFAKGMQKNIMVPMDKVEEATRSWCEGILRATSKPTNDPAAILGEENIPPEAEVIDVEGGEVEEVPGLVEDIPDDE